MNIIKINQAKKIFSLVGLFLALFLFCSPALASFDCVYTTSTGDLACDTDITLLNIETFFSWHIVLMSFILVFLIIIFFMSFR